MEFQLDSEIPGGPTLMQRFAHPMSSKSLENPKITLCQTCHATRMHLTNSYLPVLQGQHYNYLLRKIELFQSNRQTRHPFPRYSRALSTGDMTDIASYYAAQPSHLTPLVKNETLFDLIDGQQDSAVSLHKCWSCHGDQTQSDGLIPYISGQNKNYLAYRIREIASHSSNVHITSGSDFSCEVPRLNIHQSRKLAAVLALVVNQEQALEGEAVFNHSCVRCHYLGNQSTVVNVTKLVNAGVIDYARNIALSGSAGIVHQNESLSHSQWIDALHYLVSRLK